MLEKLKYINHMNEVFNFGSSGIYVNTSDLHDYEWSVTTKGSRIGNLSRKVSNRKLPIIIICKSEEEGLQAKNKLLEVTEKDVLAMKHGKVMIGNYYFRCFVTKSVKKSYLISKKYMQVELTLTSDFPYWIKESTNAFRSGGSISGTGLDYPHDFPFDFLSSTATQSLFNSHFVPSNFRLVFYGGCTDPTITVADHLYQVTCDVEEGEYLTIDSTNKTILLTKNDGTVVNLFNNRNKESYIFEKIPVGESGVSWAGDLSFDLILMEERSEPKWT